MGIPYKTSWKTRLRNYLLGWDELGLDPAPAIQHFEQLLGAAEVQPMLASIDREMHGPYHHFDAIYSLAPTHDPDRFAPLDLDSKIRWFPVPSTPHDPELGRALAIRAIVAEAALQNLDEILIFEDAITFRREQFDELLRDVPSTPSAMALWLRTR